MTNYKKQGAGPEQKFFAKKLDGERERGMFMPNYGSKTPPSYLQSEIGPARDRISSLVPLSMS